MEINKNNENNDSLGNFFFFFNLRWFYNRIFRNYNKLKMEGKLKKIIALLTLSVPVVRFNFACKTTIHCPKIF